MPAVHLRPDLRADRQLLADLPAVALNETRAGDRARARGGECRALVERNEELRVHVEIAGRIDREHRERVALVLVFAAEPIRARDARDARHLLDARQVRHRQRLDDRVARRSEEALRIGRSGARLERQADRLEQAEQQERDDNGEQCEDRARLSPKQRCAQQWKVLHACTLPLLDASVPLSS
jgi:organic radical activating enzyme